MKPTANFSFNPTGLSVKFTDSSSGDPTSWNWDFGYKIGSTEQTSTSQNPTQIFPSIGIYTITLISINSDGNSDPYSFTIILSSSPTLSLTIKERLINELPVGLAIDTPVFLDQIQYWQLYIQPLLNLVKNASPMVTIADADVFNEAKWPPLANMLITKLVAIDIIRLAAQASMSSYYAAIQLYKNLPPTTSTTQAVADYTYILPHTLSGSWKLTLNNLSCNGGSMSTPIGEYTTNSAFINALNTLGFGTFNIANDGVTLQSIGNSNILSAISITYNATTSPIGFNSNFTPSNARIIPIVVDVIIQGDMPLTPMGSLRYTETGPAKTEWYDGSTFWSSMFKSMPGASSNGSGGTGGIFENIVKDACGLARRLYIRLPMCPKIQNRNIPQFQVAGNSRRDTHQTQEFYKYLTIYGSGNEWITKWASKGGVWEDFIPIG